MTKLLERAFAKAAKLPAGAQDELATLILEEMESEDRWQALFASSPDTLARLAEEAAAEDQAGRTRPLTLPT